MFVNNVEIGISLSLNYMEFNLMNTFGIIYV